MKSTLHQLSMAVRLLEHFNADRRVSISDALTNAFGSHRIDVNHGIATPKFGQPKTIFDQDAQQIRSGEQSVEEILENSILRDQIEYWAKREQARREAWENSNVDFLNDLAEGIKAIFRGPVDRANSQLSPEDQVASQDQTKAESKKKEEEARRKADEDRQKAKEAEDKKRAEEKNKKK